MMISTAAKARADRLEKMARSAIKQYNEDMAKGGEPLFPDWALELVGLIADYDRLVAAMAAHSLRQVVAVDFETSKRTASIVQRVAS